VVDLAALAVTAPLILLALVTAVRGHETAVAAGVSVLGAAFAVLVGAIGGSPATDQVYDVGPALILLCILLILGHLAEEEGVFGWATAVLARGSDRSPVAVFRGVCLLAAVTTAILSVHASLVLLTPIVMTTVARMRLSVRPPAYACAHLANSGSLLTPVSNLTNLLAFAATGLSFLSFTVLMAVPWLVAVLVEYALLRRVFATDLDRRRSDTEAEAEAEPPPTPWLALLVLTLSVVGFCVGSLIGIAPVWPAAAGTVILAARRLIQGRSTVTRIMESARVPFALFVLGLAVLVRGLNENGLADLVSATLPKGTGLATLLTIAAIAAVLTNLVNKLTATLVLVPAVALAGAPAILAVLIGVNIGSNLTYVGSFANLLWRRVLAPHDEAPSAWNFTGTGLMTVPLTLVAATVALWISVRLFG